MPLRYLRYRPPEPLQLPPEEGQLRPVYAKPELEVKPLVMGPPPSAVGYRGSNEFLRTASNWYSIMERSYQEAVEKLKSVLKTDLKADPAPLDSIVPCLVDISEGKTTEEKERIRRAHRRMAKVFGNFFDRMVRYRPESRLYAFDAMTQDITDAKPLWAVYECSKFRAAPAEETEGKKRKKSRASPD